MVFLFYTIIILLLLFMIIVTIKIKIEIIDFKYNGDYKRSIFGIKAEQNKEFKFIIKIKIYTLKNIPVMVLKIDEKKLKKLERKRAFKKIENRIKDRMNTIEIKIIENINNWQKNIIKNIIKNMIEVVKNLKIEVKKINMKMQIGIENVIITSMLIPIISTVISFLLRNMREPEEGNRYEIEPFYDLDNYRNKINISIKCIFEVKMIHIINIMYIIIKQRKVKKHVRTSNRRAYDYSYE